MGWLIFGFLTAIGIETFFRVSSKYEPQPKREVNKTQVSLSWFDRVIAGLGVWGIWRKSKY